MGSKELHGQALAEYTLVIALIAVVCVTALTTLGTSVASFFGTLPGSI